MFFLAQGRGRESKAPGGRGGRFLNRKIFKIPGGEGVGSPGVGGDGRVSAANWGSFFWGGGLPFFFGAEMSTR